MPNPVKGEKKSEELLFLQEFHYQFAIGLRQLCPKIYGKKRYAYLVVENVGNFQNEQGLHSGSHAIA